MTKQEASKTSLAKSRYFDATEDKETRDDLKLGLAYVQGPKVAIDCGCGAGSDIAFLRSEGFTVHAFDIEAEAVERCQKRFRGDRAVILSQDSFNTFDYPRASLVVADASLFFCPPGEFAMVWEAIKAALLPGGVFVGSFLGREDSMAGPDFDGEAYWPQVLVTSEKQVKEWLGAFEILSFIEHRKSGIAPGGTHHQWHIYSVVARKTY